MNNPRYEYNKKLIKLEKNQAFILSERPRKGEYSSLTNAQKCKMQWEKLKGKAHDFLTKEKERKRKWRAEMKKDQERHARYKDDDKLRK